MEYLKNKSSKSIKSIYRNVDLSIEPNVERVEKICEFSLEKISTTLLELSSDSSDSEDNIMKSSAPCCARSTCVKRPRCSLKQSSDYLEWASNGSNKIESTSPSFKSANSSMCSSASFDSDSDEMIKVPTKGYFKKNSENEVDQDDPDIWTDEELGIKYPIKVMKSESPPPPSRPIPEFLKPFYHDYYVDSDDDMPKCDTQSPEYKLYLERLQEIEDYMDSRARASLQEETQSNSSTMNDDCPIKKFRFAEPLVMCSEPEEEQIENLDNEVEPGATADTESSKYAAPVLNSTKTALNQQLRYIENIRLKKINKIADLTPKSKCYVVNKVSQALNIPFEENIYKNLPAIDKSDSLLHEEFKYTVKRKPSPTPIIEIDEPSPMSDIDTYDGSFIFSDMEIDTSESSMDSFESDSGEDIFECARSLKRAARLNKKALRIALPLINIRNPK